MIKCKSENKCQLDKEPPGKTEAEFFVSRPESEDVSKNYGRPRNAIPEAVFSAFEMIYQNTFIRLRLGVGLRMINKKPNDVEQSRKPGDDKNYVDRFEVEDIHCELVHSLPFIEKAIINPERRVVSGEPFHKGPHKAA